MPPLLSKTTFATLGGIDPDNAATFVSHYRGSRSGVSSLVEALGRLSLSPELKYSPLILRALADGLELPQDPTSAAQLFARLADFHISRECSKPQAQGIALPPDSWQGRYSVKSRHEALVCGLLFGAERAGREMSEDEFREAAQACLDVTLDAHDLVQLSTLMSQHPLVTVTYKNHATYAVRSPHDWARIGLLPTFLDYSMIDALSAAGSHWLGSLPTSEDFADSWAWLDTQDRADSMLDFLADLATAPADAQRAATWLAPQMFHPSLEGRPVAAKLYSCVASLAGRFARADTDLTDLLNLPASVPYELKLASAELKLFNSDQVGSYSHLVLEGCSLTLEESGPSEIVLRRGSLTGCHVRVRSDCHVILEECFLDDVVVEMLGPGRLTVRRCLYDPGTCTFPDQAELVDSGQMPDRYWPWMVAEVFRRLIVTAAQPHLSFPKHMVNVENLLRGPLTAVRRDAQKVLDVMEGLGYITTTPTGPSIKRVTPTRSFDSNEVALFVRSGNPGPMTTAILDRVRA